MAELVWPKKTWPKKTLAEKNFGRISLAEKNLAELSHTRKIVTKLQKSPRFFLSIHNMDYYQDIIMIEGCGDLSARRVCYANAKILFAVLLQYNHLL